MAWKMEDAVGVNMSDTGLEEKEFSVDVKTSEAVFGSDMYK